MLMTYLIRTHERIELTLSRILASIKIRQPYPVVLQPISFGCQVSQVSQSGLTKSAAQIMILDLFSSILLDITEHLTHDHQSSFPAKI